MNSTDTHLHYMASRITDQLFLGHIPAEEDVAEICTIGVRLVISMIHARPPQELLACGMEFLRLPTYDFPLTPIPMRVLREGVHAALTVLDSGGRVLVYCRQGRHRSVVMTCSILIARGMTADEAMDAVIAGRPIADPHAFYIEPRIRKFEADWHARHAFVTGGPGVVG